MRLVRYASAFCVGVFAAAGLAWACGFDNALREYLDVHFWLPFSKDAAYFEKGGVRRVSVAYAGMTRATDRSPLSQLREAYQEISAPIDTSFDPVKQARALAAARADRSLTSRAREEVDLIDAKIDMRVGQPDAPQSLVSAKDKLQKFLQTAQTPEFLSEARGWLAYVNVLLKDRVAAGKFYLDELNRDGSNLSRETLLHSLRATYGYDGRPDLLDHLEEYFDTAEHAAFAIQLLTNPEWDRNPRFPRTTQPPAALNAPETYARITSLIERHRDLLSASGPNLLPLLLMRTALRMGDPAGALKTAAMVPANAAVRSDPDFNWMLASAMFVSRDYAAAERPLLDLFRSPRSTDNQRSAAAYGLCGVYQKTGNRVEQIRFALWLYSTNRQGGRYLDSQSGISDQTVYWAVSGWDLGLLLESEAPIDALTSFLARNPDVPDRRVVTYALAVRRSRENQYDQAADLYQSIQATERAARVRRLAELYSDAARTGLAPEATLEAKFRLAEFIGNNEDKIYFNDRLWSGFQAYALTGSDDGRLTGDEHQRITAGERKLRDDQEEYWRAYLILRDVVRDAGRTDLGRKAAQLAIRCLRRISERFGRDTEIRTADIELSNWLKQ